ncbi:MAG: hypothetical protein HOO19_08745 [Rhodospirillaceae bacterium]|jgi:hypothetical protein|nr:hypothetical protein [Rhodospirillaceae bacterium]MBT3885717.1 hypothetical protein [Rhodospirillaceae bacterium]MBT4117607.1 hypothetical protein [Rhodospirillaceae bacterium]MBT4673968.1 hypothetical protein [Rhodospirillaceae bacterium]MBT4719151.1 hypothetical protein [Rhodospirillaceae bacterium]
MADPANILAEQKDYYRARAPEYDDWWFPCGWQSHIRFSGKYFIYGALRRNE